MVAPLSQSLTPIYPTTAGLSQSLLRAKISDALDSLALERHRAKVEVLTTTAAQLSGG